MIYSGNYASETYGGKKFSDTPLVYVYKRIYIELVDIFKRKRAMFSSKSDIFGKKSEYDAMNDIFNKKLY